MGSQCASVTVIFLNILYILAGTACVVFGVLGLTETWEEVTDIAAEAVWYVVYHLPNVDPEDVFDDDIDEYDIGYVALLAGGVVLILMGFAGCIGAFQNNSCLLKTSWFLLTLVLIVELVVAVAFPIFAWVNTKEDCDTTEKKLEVLAEYAHCNKTIRMLIDFDDVQEKYGCCGVNNATDWVVAADADPNDNIINLVPDSCCKQHDDGSYCIDENDVYTSGCEEDIDEWLQDEVYLKLVICLAIGIFLAFLLIITQVMTCLLLRRMDHGEKI